MAKYDITIGVIKSSNEVLKILKSDCQVIVEEPFALCLSPQLVIR